MSDWRFYLATLHVIMLPVSRAGAIEVSLTPSGMSWYFGFLETYVFPFILAASVAMLIGYGIMRVFGKSSKEDDLYARIGPAHDPELPIIDVPDEAPDTEQVVEKDLAQDEQAELSRALRSAVESASPVSAPVDPGSLLERISTRATEQEQAGRTLDLDSVGSEAPVLENTDELVRRISARVSEQVMGLADEVSGMPTDNSEAANKLDSLLQRIGARSTEEDIATDDAGVPVRPTNGVGESASDDDGLTPAERLDALLARINAPAPAEMSPAEEPSTPEAESTGTSELQSPDRLDSIIERIGARAAGKTVEDVEVAPVAPSSPAENTPSPSDKLDELMRRIRGGAPQTDNAEPVPDDMAEPAATSGDESFAVDTVDTETAEGAAPEETEPLSPTISDEDLPDLDLETDTAMDDSYSRRVEPTFARSDEHEETSVDEAAFDEIGESPSDSPLESAAIAPDAPVESVMDMALDVKEDAFYEDTDLANAADQSDAATQGETEPKVPEVAESETTSEEAGEAALEPEEDSILEQEAVTIEEAAAGLEVYEASEKSSVVQPEVEIVEQDAGVLASEDKVDELVKRIGARVPEEPEAIPESASDAETELVRRSSARVPEESRDSPDSLTNVPGLEDEPSHDADTTDRQGEDEAIDSPEEGEAIGASEEEGIVEKPILERLIDRDRQQDTEAQSAHDATVREDVAFPPDGRLLEREDIALDAEPLPEPVAASLNGSDVSDARPIVGTEDVQDPGRTSADLSMAAAENVAPSRSANALVSRIVADLEAASSALERVSGVVEGFETAREGLDLEALGGLRLGGINLPQDAEAELQQLGDDISGAAVAGIAAVEQYNHVIDQLAEMAQDEPLDEGWNELLQDRVQETIAAIAGVSRRMRDIIPGEARAGERGHGESDRDDPSSAGVSAGGE